MIKNTNENSQLSETAGIVSADDLLKIKNIRYPELILDEKYNIHTLIGLMNEWACIYSKNYLNYAKIIDLIDESDDLKELEIRVNMFFKSKRE